MVKLIVCMLAIVALSACGPAVFTPPAAPNNAAFRVVASELIDTFSGVFVLEHKKTGVCLIVVRGDGRAAVEVDPKVCR